MEFFLGTLAVVTVALVCALTAAGLVGALLWFLTRRADRRDTPLWLRLRGFPDTAPTALPLGEVATARGQVVYLSEDRRHTHQLVLGASGTGKSKALAGWIAHDVLAGNGLILIDPHEELVRDVLALTGDKMVNPVILAAGDPKWAIGYNPLQGRPGMSSYQVASALLDVFKKVWEGDWGVWMHDYLLHAFWAMAAAGWTMLEVPRFLIDPHFRAAMVGELRRSREDVGPLLDWIAEYDAKTPGQQRQERQSTMVRVRQFVSDPNIRVIIGQRANTITFERVIREATPFLVSLTWRELKVNAYLLGALLLSQLQDEILSGPTVGQRPRPTTYFYVDEFQEMATDSFVEVLAQARKFGLSVVLSTQTLKPLGTDLIAAVKANCRNLCVFACSHEDATAMAHEIFVDLTRQPAAISHTGRLRSSSAFEPRQREYVEHIKAQFPRYFWMRRKGQSKALQLRTLTVSLPDDAGAVVRRMVDQSGRTYGRPRAEVERELKERREQIAALVAHAGTQVASPDYPDDPDAVELGD